MESNVILFGWNRPIPGREQQSREHFGEFVSYLEGLTQQGRISSFDTVFLDPHGGDLNGFFLIHADHTRLDNLVSSDEWGAHMIRASLHLDGSGAVRGQSRELIESAMATWSSLLPK